LLDTFHPAGEIAVSWFRGPFREFVEHCKRGGPSKHLIAPPFVRIVGDRAVAETSIMILVRQTIDGIAVDMTSRARFLDRRAPRRRRGPIRGRAAISEQARLAPVVPSVTSARIMQAAATSPYPDPYRYRAGRLAAAGRPRAEPVHHDGAPATAA